MKILFELQKRRDYVSQLIGECRPQCSQSSQEWVNPEFWAVRDKRLWKELDELDAKIKKLNKKSAPAPTPREPGQ